MDSTRREFMGFGAAAAAGLLAGCGPDMKSRRPAPAGTESALSVPIPPPIPAERYARRRADLAARMREEGFDLLLVTPGVPLTYLTGAFLRKSDRLIAWVLEKDGSCRCLGPAFEEERLACSGLPGDRKNWEETEDPIALLAEILASRGSSPRIAVEGTLGLDILAPLARRLPAARIASATPILSALRMRKDPEEIALMQAAIDITLEATRRVMQEAKEGVTEEGMLARAVEVARAFGASLDGMIQFGPSSAVPHAGAGEARLRHSDVILFDLVAEVRGYHSDISRTFAFGDSSRRFQQIYRVVRQAQEEGFRAARPGIPAGKVDEAARSAVQRNGFGRYFTHRVGHGLGLEAHEEPYLGGGNKLVLEDGMTVTVGPGIYLPGEFGVRLVDVVLVTATGPRVLSAPPAPPV